MAKQLIRTLTVNTCLADAGKGTVAKPARSDRGVDRVLPTLEKELWQSLLVICAVRPAVLPTLEKELWQSQMTKDDLATTVLPTLEKELWQST